MFNFSIILVYTEINKYKNTKYLIYYVKKYFIYKVFYILAEKNCNTSNLHRLGKKKFSISSSCQNTNEYCVRYDFK